MNIGIWALREALVGADLPAHPKPGDTFSVAVRLGSSRMWAVGADNDPNTLAWVDVTLIAIQYRDGAGRWCEWELKI